MNDDSLPPDEASEKFIRLENLIAQLDDADLDEAIMLMEWLLSPELRDAVGSFAVAVGKAHLAS